MTLPIDAVPARYQGQRVTTIRVMVGGKSFDLGLSGTAQVQEPEAARLTLRNLYEQAGARVPTDIDEQAMQLTATARDYLKWKPPVPKRRGMKRRAAWNWKTT